MALAGAVSSSGRTQRPRAMSRPRTPSLDRSATASILDCHAFDEQAAGNDGGRGGVGRAEQSTPSICSQILSPLPSTRQTVSFATEASDAPCGASAAVAPPPAGVCPRRGPGSRRRSAGDPPRSRRAAPPDRRSHGSEGQALELVDLPLDIGPCAAHLGQRRLLLDSRIRPDLCGSEEKSHQRQPLHRELPGK